MNRSGATLAIVTARLARSAHAAALSCAACAFLAYLQRYDDASAALAGSLAYGALSGIAAALLQRGIRRFRELELCEQSAPLYGRELARATAMVPCVIALAAVGAYWGISALFRQPNPQDVAVAICGSLSATLVAMCAAVRSGLPRAVYIAICIALSACAFALAHFPGAAVALCAAAGFIALRQYGEALARYSPL